MDGGVLKFAPLDLGHGVLVKLGYRAEGSIPLHQEDPGLRGASL